jgi:endonuclease/exonuclease/phosphatase family metal-dependent hydrolase
MNNVVEKFLSSFVRTGNVVTTNLPVGMRLSYDTFAGGDSDVLADGADTRIMSFNILSEEWDSAAVLAGRDVRVSATILNYHPDVAALQEVSNKWYPILENYIGNVYKFTRKTTPSGKGTYTTLIYNTETTKLIEEDIYLYSVGNSDRLRSIAWGLFESKVTGEQYIVFSTHWDVGAERQPNRVKQAKEMANLAKSLGDKYKVDVYVCGDYNASESTEEYKNFLKDAGYVDAKTDAKVKNRACKTYHTLFSNLDTSVYESIDHITFSKDIASKVLFYNTLINDYVIDASDHCPIYIDIVTKK